MFCVALTLSWMLTQQYKQNQSGESVTGSADVHRPLSVSPPARSSTPLDPRLDGRYSGSAPVLTPETINSRRLKCLNLDTLIRQFVSRQDSNCYLMSNACAYVHGASAIFKGYHSRYNIHKRYLRLQIHNDLMYLVLHCFHSARHKKNGNTYIR